MFGSRRGLAGDRPDSRIRRIVRGHLPEALLVGQRIVQSNNLRE
jgi:hypothetical protein